MRPASPQPDLQQSSSSSSSVSSIATRTDDSTFVKNRKGTSRSEEASDDRKFSWTKETKDGFVGFILPFISSGKKLSREDVKNICAEAKRIGLPLEILDRLFEQQSDYYKQKKQESTCRQKYKNKDFEDIDDIDESENILAYFTRMAILKEGGHLPKLNTEAIESFVETASSSVVSEDIEVDLDVGYVKKSLDLSYDEAYANSWEEGEDVESNASTTIQGRNRYERKEDQEHDDNIFGSLIIGETLPRRVTFALDSDGEDDNDKANKKEKMARQERKQEEKKDEQGDHKTPSSSRRYKRDWNVCRRRRRDVWHYGYAQDLDEWKLKNNMALWHFKPDNESVFARATSCHSGSNAPCAQDDSAGLSQLNPPTHISGQVAVQNLFASKQERLRRRKEKDERRHVPVGFSFKTKPWQLAFKERCKANPGYIGVQQYSLLDSTGINLSPDPRDRDPWESRDVRQHFLHDQSISFSRNWFGKLPQTDIMHNQV